MREIGVTGVDLGVAGRREEVKLVPDAAAGEAVDDIHAKEFGGAGSVGDILAGALAHAFRLAIAPDARRQDRLMAGVDRVADALPDEMRADRPAAQPVLFEQVTLLAHIAVAFQRLIDLKMVAPTGQL